jgi:hypothetical protein
MWEAVVLRRHACRAVLVVLVTASLPLVWVGQTSAATLTVCSTGCAFSTVAAAVAAASDGDKIVVGPGTYSGGFTIDKNVALVGSGSRSTTIAGGAPVIVIGTSRVVTINGVTITGGSSEFGGGIRTSGSLTLRESVVRGNSAELGGGILSSGSLQIKDSVISGNSAFFGGGLFNDGTSVLSDSVISGNRAAFAGGVFNNAVLTLRTSVVTGNTATNAGGIANFGSLTVLDTTVSGNTPNDCVGPC